MNEICRVNSESRLHLLSLRQTTTVFINADSFLVFSTRHVIQHCEELCASGACSVLFVALVGHAVARAETTGSGLHLLATAASINYVRALAVVVLLAFRYQEELALCPIVIRIHPQTRCTRFQGCREKCARDVRAALGKVEVVVIFSTKMVGAASGIGLGLRLTRCSSLSVAAPVAAATFSV